jgi:hypothetical protein
MRACWPYFRPDPLLGFALQSFAPPTQPYAVSGASYPLDVGDTTLTPTSSQKGKPNREAHNAEARTELTAFRVLLRVRVRHIEAAVYTATKRVALLGLHPLQGSLPCQNGTAFTAPPLSRLVLPSAMRPTEPLHRVSLTGRAGSSPKRPPTLMGFLAS